ncbi:protein SERAC1-like protein [Leptotrombidium deliense]|uniref:Protein SERAC1 n=1 Tax=Leptotrombidium deliense TaxID=299467 RepID=A0A443SQC9_9ACAR|nr:protein SERAC1-like protein [Leptotrombidium deliense]
MCDLDTAVKLARTENVDPRLFAPPITSHLRLIIVKKQLVSGDDLSFLLLKLLHDTIEDVSECTKYFTSLALKANEVGASFDSEIQHVEMIPEGIRKQNFVSKYKLDWFLAQSLLGYSKSGEKTCEKLIESGVFLVLHNLREKYENDNEMLAVVAKIVSNLSKYPQSHQHFMSTGWIGILCNWLNSDSNVLELKLAAAKCLYNLDRDIQFSLSDSVYLVSPMYRNKTVDCDIVFIHGLLGRVFRTWRQSDLCKNDQDYTRCWPLDWLSKDISAIRIMAADYETYLSDWRIECPTEKLTLKDRGEYILQSLIAAGIGNRPIIWIGHSMGGLLIKQILVACEESNSPVLKEVLRNSKATVFYSVPHRGSELATWPTIVYNVILPSTEVKELMKDSPVLLSLQNKFLNIVRKRQLHCISFAETLKSKLGAKKVKIKSLMVSKESANLGYGEFHLLSTDHHSTCKPVNKNSDSYRLTLEFILDVINNLNIS